MRIQSCDFILDLLLKGEFPSVYTGSMFNKIIETEIKAIVQKLVANEVPILIVGKIPSYINLTIDQSCGMNYKSVEQYQGFALDLSNFKDAIEYIAKVLSKQNKKNLLAKKKKLEKSGDIHYQVYSGESVDKELYDKLFKEFYMLLKLRFNQKKVYNRDLPFWGKLKDTVYPLLLKKKASLFTIYDGPNLINITLNFHLGHLICSHIQAFDMNYGSFNLPDIALLKQLEWCYNHDILMYDLMLGHTYYKEKWSNTVYSYSTQVFFRPDPLPTLIASLFITYLKAKLFLQKWIIPESISRDRILYWLKGGNA